MHFDTLAKPWTIFSSWITKAPNGENIDLYVEGLRHPWLAQGMLFESCTVSVSKIQMSEFVIYFFVPSPPSPKKTMSDENSDITSYPSHVHPPTPPLDGSQSHSKGCPVTTVTSTSGGRIFWMTSPAHLNM